MTVKLSDEQIFLRKCIKAIEGLLKETGDFCKYSEETAADPVRIQWEGLRAHLNTAKYHAKLINSFIETQDVVYMIPQEDGTFRKANRQQIIKLLSKSKDITEVLPDE